MSGGESRDIHHGASEDANGEKTKGRGGQKEPTEIMNGYRDKNKSCDMEKQIQNNRTEDLKTK